MAAEQFCLRWNNFQSNIASALGSLKAEQDLVDVTLTCGGRNVKAHKVILSACSPYFRTVFKENPCQHPVVILKDVRYDDVLALLSFMYQGEVFINQDQLASFLETAELLQVRGLTGAINPVKEPAQTKSGLAPPPLSNILQKASALQKSATITSTHSSSRATSITTHQLKQALGASKRSLPSRSASPPSEASSAGKEQSSAPSSPQPVSKRRKAVPRRVSTSSLVSSDPGTETANSNSSAPDVPRGPEDSLALLDNVTVNLSEVKQEPNSESVSVSAENELHDNNNEDDDELYNYQDGEENERDDARSGFYMDLDESNEAGTSSLLARSLAGVSPRSTDGQGNLTTNNQPVPTDLTSGGDGSKAAIQCGTCPHCGQNYSNLSALKYHVRLVHSDLTNRLCCHLCPRSFVQREQYRQHMWEKHGTRN